jgi:hypothetical protein
MKLKLADQTGHRPIEMKTHPAAIEDEPASEVWARLLKGQTIAEVSEDLGYSLQYGCRLAAQAASKEIVAGANYEFCANLFGVHEAAGWKQIQKQLGDEILAKTVQTRRIWFLNRIRSLHLAGESPATIAVALGSTETEIESDLRTAFIVANRLRGDTLESIASSLDISRERVRQLLKKLGIDNKFLSEREAANNVGVNETREAISEWIQEHPGCTPAEIALIFGVPENVIAGMIPRRSAHLVLNSRFEKAPKEMEARKNSKSRIIQAIRHAATIHDEETRPHQSETLYLTGPRYTSLQKRGLIDGPTVPRILQVFGTWHNACDNSGVSCDEPVRETYVRRWSRTEMSRSVAEFLITEGHNGVSKYDKWARVDDTRPGFMTIRNEFGGWKTAYEEALRLLRTNWVLPPRGR